MKKYDAPLLDEMDAGGHSPRELSRQALASPGAPLSGGEGSNPSPPPDKSAKVGCPSKGCTMYVAACLANCPDRAACRVLRDYLSPKEGDARQSGVTARRDGSAGKGTHR